MNILITGAKGFVGRNLGVALRRREGVTLYGYDLGTDELVVKDDVGRYAEKAGLYVLTQTDEGGAALLNREGFEPKTFN